jgi:hypothetical protein
MGEFHRQGEAQEYDLVGSSKRRFQWRNGEPVPAGARAVCLQESEEHLPATERQLRSAQALPYCFDIGTSSTPILLSAGVHQIGSTPVVLVHHTTQNVTDPAPYLWPSVAWLMST